LHSELLGSRHLHSIKPREDAKRLGAIYTPDILAHWAASLLTARLPENDCIVLDPACGDGALLKAVSNLTKGTFVGVDCDPTISRIIKANIENIEFHERDAYLFLEELANNKRLNNFSGIIANPPWGAEVKISRTILKSLGYELASGQFDSWDIFVEGVLKASLEGTIIVLILPDSIFLPEHEPVRLLIASQTKIDLIARLGEGFFPGVYRGTVLVSMVKGTPSPESKVRCLRLSPADRRAAFNGSINLTSLLNESSHLVDQARFLEDRHTRFDIDLKGEEQQHLSLIENFSFPWSDLTLQGRGIELSKSGAVLACPRCDTVKPFPRETTGSQFCSACHTRITDIRTCKREIIRALSSNANAEWMPLIVGEDVTRHFCAPSREIQLGVPGIRYKVDNKSNTKKLLVRKTGIGIKAAIDETGAATNQVVFHFLARNACEYDLLEYLSGVMCSRIMLAWYLKRIGELEWRSHPYITQKVIMTLPIPNPDNPSTIAQAKGIANAVSLRPANCMHDHPIDLFIECLVAGLYGMSEEDMKWAFGVLDSAQGLESIKSLRISNSTRLTPISLRSGSLNETIDCLQKVVAND